MTTLSLLARQDDFEREAVGRSPVRVISLLVWSSLYPDAREVGIEFKRNALGGMMAILIAAIAAGEYVAVSLSRGKRS